jgi:hypothetical protein
MLPRSSPQHSLSTARSLYRRAKTPQYPLIARRVAVRKLSYYPLIARCIAVRRYHRHPLLACCVSVRRLHMGRPPVGKLLVHLPTWLMYSVVSLVDLSRLIQTTLSVFFSRNHEKTLVSCPFNSEGTAAGLTSGASKVAYY